MTKWVLLPLRGGRTAYVNLDGALTIEQGSNPGQTKLWFGGAFLSELFVELSPDRVHELAQGDAEAADIR